MTADHPTIETIADHAAGMLQPEHAASVAAHLYGCAACTAASRAVEEVSTRLAREGADLAPMPDDVALRIDQALRQAAADRAGDRADGDRAGRVVPLQRPAGTAAPPPARRHAWPLLAAAATVLVAVGAAVIGEIDLSVGGSAESSVAGDAPAPEQARPESDAGAAAGGAATQQLDGDKNARERDRLKRLSPARLPGYAGSLAQSPGQISTQFSAASARCAQVPAGPEVSSAAADVVSTIRWRGAPAVLVVDPQGRTATVLDCETASEVLFRTTY